MVKVAYDERPIVSLKVGDDVWGPAITNGMLLIGDVKDAEKLIQELQARIDEIKAEELGISVEELHEPSQGPSVEKIGRIFTADGSYTDMTEDDPE